MTNTRSTRRRKVKSGSTKKKRRGGGLLTSGLLAFGRIRGQKYEDLLEDRLVLYHNDIQFVTAMKARFGYDKTSLRTFNKESVVKDVCERPLDDRTLILGDKATSICKTFDPK